MVETLSVAAFNRLVAQSLSRQFPSVRIVGEVAQLTVASSGHRYLTLRDAQASLRAVIFKGDAGELSCLPSEGQRVEVLASAALYEPRGDFQVRIVAMKPAGQGSLFEAFLRLKALLTAQGLFDPAGRRERPAHLVRVGVVTSAAGAALRDVLVTLHKEAPHLAVVVFASLVQGAEAPKQLVEAISRARAYRASDGAPLEALVLTRGGGSMEGLWAFNDESVVRAFWGFHGHRVSGVGHETDTTLVDFAADHRAATPTAAAEWLAASSVASRQQIGGLHRRVDEALRRQWFGLQQRLDLAARGLVHPRERLAQHHRALVALGARWRALTRHGMALRAAGLERSRLRLGGLDPKSVLSRGYAMVLDTAGAPVVSAAGLAPGMSVCLNMRDGRVDAQVRAIHPQSPKTQAVKAGLSLP